MFCWMGVGIIEGLPQGVVVVEGLTRFLFEREGYWGLTPRSAERWRCWGLTPGSVEWGGGGDFKGLTTKYADNYTVQHRFNWVMKIWRYFYLSTMGVSSVGSTYHTRVRLATKIFWRLFWLNFAVTPLLTEILQVNLCISLVIGLDLMWSFP